jgi:hypothetical protein
LCDDVFEFGHICQRPRERRGSGMH